MNMNFIKKSIRIEDVVSTPIIASLSFLAGNIVHEVIMREEIARHIADPEEISTFPLGTLMAIIVSLMLMVFVSFQVFSSHFNLEISMGCTRKEFFLHELVNQVVRIGFGLLLLNILYRLETWKLKAWYGQYVCEMDMSWFFDWKIQLPLFVFLLGLILMVGGFFLKFSQYALYAGMVFYFALCLLFTQIKMIADPFVAMLANVNLTLQQLVMIGIAVLCLVGCVAVWLSWVMMRKQPVKL